MSNDSPEYRSIHDHMHWEDGKLVDDPFPVDDQYMPPEQVEKLLKEERTRKATRKIMQQIVGESIYQQDMIWVIWHASYELEETNQLPDGVTAEDVFQMYLNVFHHER